MEYPFRPFETWPVKDHARWIHAGHTFGMHLMQCARDQAMSEVPDDSPPQVREIADRVAFTAIYGVMQMLDGFYRNAIDGEHQVEYILNSRVLRDGDVVEEFEIAPDGDGLCMAIHGWWKNEFWV